MKKIIKKIKDKLYKFKLKRGMSKKLRILKDFVIDAYGEETYNLVVDENNRFVITDRQKGKTTLVLLKVIHSILSDKEMEYYFIEKNHAFLNVKKRQLFTLVQNINRYALKKTNKHILFCRELKSCVYISGSFLNFESVSNDLGEIRVSEANNKLFVVDNIDLLINNDLDKLKRINRSGANAFLVTGTFSSVMKKMNEIDRLNIIKREEIKII